MFITLYFIVTRLPDSLSSVRDHFLSLDPIVLTVNLLEQHLLAAETNAVAVGDAHGTPRMPFFEGCSPSPLAPSYVSAAAVDILGAEDDGAASASEKCCSSKGKGGRGGGGGSGSGGGGSSGGGGGSGGGGSSGSGGGSGGFGGVSGGSGGGGGSGGSGSGGDRARASQRGGSGGGQRQQHQRRSETPSPQQLGDHAGQTCGKPHLEHRCFSRLDDSWRAEFGAKPERPRWAELLRSGVAIFDLDYDVILADMYALSVSAEGDCYLCVPPDPGIETVALGASESSLPKTAPGEALHTFTLDSGASRCFFRDSTTLIPLSAPVPIRLADPSGGPVLACSSTVLPCPAVLSGSLSGLHLPSFSTNLVRTAALQETMVTTTTPWGQRVLICTCIGTGRHLATFTRRPGSSLYTLATEPPQVAASAQVSASGQVAPPCSCRLLWHHHMGHPSLPRLRGMHSRLLVSGLPRSLPPLPPSLAPPCLPCVKGWKRAASKSSSFPPTTAPLQTLHMDVWSPARFSGQGRECYILLVVGDYKQYTTVSPLCTKDQVVDVLIPWIRTLRLQPRERLCHDLPFLRLHSVRGVMEVARTSMIHAAAPHFLWPFAVQYAVHQLNLWPRVSLPETSPTLRWMREVGDVSGFRGPAPSGVSRVDPLLGTAPVEVAVGSRAVQGATSGGVASMGAGPRGAESEGAGSGGSEPRGAEPGGAEPARVEPGGAEPEGVEPRGAESEGAESRGAEPRGTASSGAAGAGDTGAGGAGPGGARTKDTGAAGTGGVGLAGAGDPTQPGGAEARGAGAVGAGAGGTGAGGAGAGGAGATTGGLTERHEPASRPACPVRNGRRVPRPRPPPVPGIHAMALRPSSVPLCIPMPLPPESSLPGIPDPESDRTRAAIPTVSHLLTTVVTYPSFESKAASALVAELVDLATTFRLTTSLLLLLSLSLPVLRPTGRAMDVEMASWKSTSTYVDEVPPPGANIVDEPLGAVSRMAGPEERGGRGAGGSGEAQAQGQPRDSAMTPVQPSLGPPWDEPRVFGLDKFNGDNFPEWSFRMENLFDHYDLLEVMEGTEKRPENDPEKSAWVRKSAQGYLLLGQALGSSQIRHIKPFQREPEKGPKAWAALKGVHAPATAAVAVVLERQMAALRIEEDEAVEEGVQKFFDLLTRLEGADSNYSELQKKTKLLALLPESWSSLIIDLNRDLPRLLLEDVKRAILQEDFRRRELASADGAGVAIIGREYGCGRGRGRGGGRSGSNSFNGGRGSGGYGSDNKSYGRGRGRFDGECHYCHKSGHMWNGDNESESRDDRFPGQFFFVSTQAPAGPEKDEIFEEPAAVGKVTLHSLDYWVIDSGATYSMTPHADLLTELEPSPVKHVTAALGQRAEVKGMGKAMFKGADGKMVGLKNVLWVPNLAANLISVRRLQKAGMDTSSKGAKTYTARLGERILWDLHEDRDVYNEMWQIPVVPMPKDRQVAASISTKGEVVGSGDGANGRAKEMKSKKCNLGGTSKLGEHKESGAAAQKQHKGEENPKAAAEEEYGENMWGTLASAAFSNPTSATGECDWLTLHRRMGHVALPILQQLVKNEMVAVIRVKGEPDEVLGCPTCMQAKFTRYPFSSSEATAKAPLDEVVMDVVAPLKLGAAGAEYFLTIVDVLSKKSDVAETVKTDWLPMVERQQDWL
ncbi:unnamed protein product, partial [Closterium sp. NIES-54]